MKKLFLSATYKDLRDCIEEVKSRLGEIGVEVHHFKEGPFFDGIINRSPHDRCIELVKEVPNYMLIVSFEGGQFYRGKDQTYEGLTITHAEFRAAVNAFNEENRRIFTFVRKEAWSLFENWKLTGKKKRYISGDIDPNVFTLLEDIERSMPFTDFFDTSIDLKKLITDKITYLV